VTVINWTVVGRTKLTALATVECSADELGRVVYHTERPLLYASEAGWAHRASPSATADTCWEFDVQSPATFSESHTYVTRTNLSTVGKYVKTKAIGMAPKSSKK